MGKDTFESFASSDLLRKHIALGEPTLSENERQGMWKAIERRTILRSRRSLRMWRWCAAASVFAIVVGSWLFSQACFQSDPYGKMTRLVNVDTLRHISLYLGEQQVELDGQIEVRCLAATNQVEVKSVSGASFRLSATEQEETYLQLAVPAGIKAEVVLADGSRITVREQSKFSFPLCLAGEKRRVYLEGEAHMKIARNINKQFVTETRNMNVTVLGTEFLVSAYPKSSEQSVLLVSGKVEVEPLQGSRLVLSPNQRYVFNTTTQKSSLDSDVDPTLYTCWRENLLEIKDEPLGDVLKSIEAIYQTNFNYDWNELAQIRINGKLDVSVPLDELLDRLVRIAPIRLDGTRRKIILNNNR
ncbi:FecR domain-containing protein [Bacteroides uniformis]|jgi:transmembrane sensor|uniref:Anti-sigma factor n=1 Tax=Bacteroides uniformis TaxID=820 RepID=A0A174HEK4_BACUN|nr:FecR domain-containing protein [Bacteroides uniformis]MBT8722859.1 FecR domain-containing protein [Bacteroides uniformis]MDT4444647.1 FecR domain-containing protein [Bacteroides uniformis]CUO72701.1 anti-sigma factor [Bacteroides uniformis]